MKPTAVFLDRDGTIIEDPGYLSDPDQVRLLPGAAGAIRRLTELGHLIIIVSNQSGVARGLFDEVTVSKVHARLEAMLRDEGASLGGAYYCPYLDGPEAKVEAYRVSSELRKPSPGMLLQAAQEHGIDLARSWMIGDSDVDVEAGRRAGCATIRIAPDAAHTPDRMGATHTAHSLSEAADILERNANREREAETPPTPAAQSDAVVDLLRKIHDKVDRLQRHDRQQDFSLVRLFGALLQMSAIVVAVWGLWTFTDERADIATARFMLACFLQIASLSALFAARFR